MSTSIDQYNALAGSRLTRGTINSPALASNGTVTQDVEVRGTDWLSVFGELDAAGADADLSVTVTPYEPDNNTVLTAFTITPSPTGGPTKQADNVSRFSGKYDVIPYDRVRIMWKNNNAGAKTVRGSWRVQGY